MQTAEHRKWSPDQELDTPFKRARQEWDNRMGGAAAQALNWRFAAFASFALSLACIIGLIYVASLPKIVPHIIEVDRLGAASYRGPAGESASTYTPSEAVVSYHLRQFLEFTRSVSSDPAIVKRNWINVYRLATTAGANMLTSYVHEHGNPVELAAEKRVTVELLSSVPVSRDTWQIDWRETSYDKNGNPTAAETWRGMFRIVLKPSTKPEELAANPIGLYVDEFHWDRVKTSFTK